MCPMAILSLKTREKYSGLQNFLLNTNEKKLMVSPEMLMQTAALYIKNRRASISDDLNVIKSTQKIAVFFSRYDSAMKAFDELIAIEPYFDYLPPPPSEEKAKLEAMLEGLISGLIKRSWEYIKSGAAYDPSIFVRSDSGEINGRFFSAFDPYLDRLPQGNINTLEELKLKIISDAEEKQNKEADGFSAVV